MSTFVTLVRDSLFSIAFHLAPRFANVLLFILIGRLTGPSEAGVFVLATTYLLIFTTVMRGIDDLIVRQVSREPDRAANYLTSFLLLRFGLSFVLYGVLWFVAAVIFDYSESTTHLVLILGLSVIPDSLTYVAQSVLLGKRLFKIPAIVFTGISLFKITIGTITLLGDGGLYQIAWIWLAGSALGTAVMLPITIINIGGIPKVSIFDQTLITSHKQAILMFMFLTTLTTLETQSDTLLLSGFHSETEVGWYGAATTIVYSLIMISQAYRFAVYPLMSHYALHAPEKLNELYKHSLHYLLMLVLPMVAGINLLSFQIVPLIFGHQFLPIIDVINILVFTLFFVFMNEPSIRMMLVHDQQNKISWFLLTSASVNVLLNLLLVPSLGAVGAAIARVSSAGIYFLLNYIYVTLFFAPVNLFKLFPKPLAATFLMVVVVLLIRTWPLFVSVCLGGITYFLVLRVVGGISSHEIHLLRQTIFRKSRYVPNKTSQ